MGQQLMRRTNHNELATAAVEKRALGGATPTMAMAMAADGWRHAPTRPRSSK